MTAASVTQSIQYPEATRLLIGGEWTHAREGKTFAAINPATRATLAQVASGTAEDVDLAVRAARRAFEHGEWPALTPRQRSNMLFRLADLIEAHAQRLATLESMDNGKPIRETLAFDIPQVVETFRYYAGWADKLTGEMHNIGSRHSTFTLREPVGVVGQIIPWNFPLLMAAWKLAPALAAGNTVILKPAEQTPLTALELGRLIGEASIPPGVVNIVTGDGVAGAALASHTGIDKIAFTGSTEVGRAVMAAASRNLTKVSLELGGKSPNIVFEDADIDQAVAGAMIGIFFNQGEVCCAGSRLYLHERIHDEFVEKFAAAAQEVVIGDPLNPETTMGSLVSEEQYERVMRYIQEGQLSGATLRAGGRGLLSEKGGYFVTPTLFTNVKQDMTICREEIFGPVLSAQKFSDTDDLLHKANDTLYGLAAGVWTQNMTRALQTAKALRAGTVWVNCYNAFDVAIPFGGFKQSGFGRELGRHALDLYTQEKAVWLGLAP